MGDKIFRTSFMGYYKEDVLMIIEQLNIAIEKAEAEQIPPEYAEIYINQIMVVGIRTAVIGFNRKQTDKYISELISRITGKDYGGKYRPDYITPAKTFFMDTWIILLAIFIVTASILYILIFDGSEMPAVISFMTCVVLFTVDMFKLWIFAIKDYFKCKKTGKDTDTSKFGIAFQSFWLIFALWFLANIVNIMLFGGNLF